MEVDAGHALVDGVSQLALANFLYTNWVGYRAILVELSVEIVEVNSGT